MGLRRLRLLVSAAVATTVLVVSNAASAQDAPPAQQPLPPPAQQPYTPAPAAQPQPYVYGQAPAPYAYQGPAEIHNYEEGDPVPPGYHPVERTRKGPVIAGTIVFTTLYFFTAVAAMIDADGDGNAQALWIPCAGPFIQMAKTDDSGLDSLLILDGLGQSAGLALLIYGLASSKTVLVRNDIAKTDLKIMPMRGAHFTGLSLGGTF
jgi:hypothetical protein